MLGNDSFELLHSLMKKLFFFIHFADSVRHLFKCMFNKSELSEAREEKRTLMLAFLTFFYINIDISCFLCGHSVSLQLSSQIFFHYFFMPLWTGSLSS